jgi:hypothetical protein
MIVDCNVSLGHWPFRRLRDADPAGFVRWMDDCGVTQAWVAPFEALLFGPVQEANEMLAEALEGYEDRLIQVPVVNPAYPGWEDDLRELLEQPGPALRLLPNYHGYSLARIIHDRCGGARRGGALGPRGGSRDWFCAGTSP